MPPDAITPTHSEFTSEFLGKVMMPKTIWHK